LGKGWAKIQPFVSEASRKRLGQNTTFWEKVGPKYNLLSVKQVGKGWAKIQPFVSEASRKRLG